MAERRALDPVGRRLEEARQARGLTLSELAARSGVPIPTLSLLSRGVRKGENMSLRVARRLCLALGISLDWLSGRWVDDPEVSLPPETEWLLNGPGGLQQVVDVVLAKALETLMAPHRARHTKGV